MQINKLKSLTQKLNKKHYLIIFFFCLSVFFVFKNLTTSTEIDSSKLEALMNTSPPKNTVNLASDPELVHEQVQGKPKLNRAATPEEIKFIVSRDFEASILVNKMMSEALNPELQKQWLSLTLAKNAQRERTRLAKLKFEEDQATYQSTVLKKKNAALALTTVTADNSASFLEGDHSALNSKKNKEWPQIKLLSIAKDQSATFMVNGQRFSNRKTADSISGLTLSEVSFDDGCVSFMNGNVKRFCI